MPKISVCIPVRNGAPYLAAAIDSVLAQDRGDFELVVCDNASTDETPAICARYSDPRVRVVRFEESVGQAANWNRCLELARGDYVVLLHGDDELAPQYLRRAAGVLDAEPDVGLVCCAVRHIDSAGAPLDLQTIFDDDTVDRDEEVLHRLLLDGCVINPAGVMVRRSSYDAVGEFTDRVVWGVDWHMWIRIAMTAPVAYLAEPLARYREHGQSGTTAVLAGASNADDELWALNDAFRIAAARGRDLSGLREAAMRGVGHRTWCFAEIACQKGDNRATRAGLRKAAAIDRHQLATVKYWGLWAASVVGYRWFADAVQRRRALGGRVSRARTPGARDSA